MIPTVFIQLAALPLHPVAGKLDVNELRKRAKEHRENLAKHAAGGASSRGGSAAHNLGIYRHLRVVSARRIFSSDRDFASESECTLATRSHTPKLFPACACYILLQRS